MSAQADPAQRVAIGLSFGNSYSSIAYTTGEGKAEVIANEGRLIAYNIISITNHE
jgi:molecular chaperone DnaK (HSP70)